MTKFRIYYTTVKSAHIDVDAENLDEAIDLAEKRESEIFNNDGALDFDPYTYDFNKCMEWNKDFDDFDYKNN
jgi:hypothetical protein